MDHDNIDANVATARELVKDHGHTVKAAATWLHAQVPGVFKDEADAETSLVDAPATEKKEESK